MVFVLPKFLSAFVPRGVSPAAFLKRLQPRRFHNPELHWILCSRCCESKLFNCLSQRYSFWQPFFSRIGLSSRAFSSYDNPLYVVPVVADVSLDAFQNIHTKFFTVQWKERKKEIMLQIKMLKN